MPFDASEPSPHRPFAALLPPAVAVALADRAALWEDGLLPQELALVARAVPKRRREFTAGRNCARAAMRAIGVADDHIGAIGVGAHREPLFPHGVIGSITHSDDFCAAAVAHAGGELFSLGIDADANQPLGPALVAMVMQPAEWSRWQAGVPAGCEPAVLAFSIKEAFFKAFFPLCRRYLEFSDLLLAHRPDGGLAFTLPDPALAALLHGLRLDGRHGFDAHRVYSAVTLLRDGR